MNLLKEYFSLAEPTNLTKKILETKYKKENSEFVEQIKLKWSISKDEKGKNVKYQISLKDLLTLRQTFNQDMDSKF